MKTSYQYLQELCALPAGFNARTPQRDPRNPRVRYLLRELAVLGVEHHLDAFAADGSNRNEPDTLRFANVMACVRATLPVTATLVLLAHHDVADTTLENANDNTASLANLLALLGNLQAQPLPDRTIWVAFTDAEELCSFHRSGAWHLAQRIRQGELGVVHSCLNLELTAHGSALFSDYRLPGLAAAADVPVPTVPTPYNDCTVLRRWGITSCATIGTLPPAELQGLLLAPDFISRTWARCHRPNDRLVHANAQDMARFVKVLVRIARHLPLTVTA